jgi:hypothetical protein
VRVDITGTVEKPQYSSQALATISWPLRSLRTVLESPFAGSDTAP